MKKYIYNEQNGPWYELQDDYYISFLVLYTNLLLMGKLNSHLAEIDYQATEIFDCLVKQ